MLNYEFPPLGGGAGNATYYMLKEFSKYPNLEIDLVTSSVDKSRTEKFSKNITIHFLDIGKKGNLHYQSNKDLLTYSWKTYNYSKELIKTKEFDVCHAFFGIPCGYIAMKLKDKYSLPYIVSLRGSDVPFYNKRFYLLDLLIFKRLSKKIWKNSKKIIALSHDLINIARRTSLNQEISVIYNGINTEEFKHDKKLLSNEKTINLLFVGRLIERKGLIYLLQSFFNLEKNYPNLRLRIAGDGPLLENYSSLVKQKGVDKKIIFYGRLEHNKINELYKKSHIFVLPSLNEALGNVTQEALASGLPIITTKTGASELIKDNGIFIEKEDSKSLTDALQILIKDRKLREKMGKISRQLAEKMSWEECANKYLFIYKKI